MTTLTFQNKTLSVINQYNQIWLSTNEIAKALGYASVIGVARLYNAHQDEFTQNMTALIDMPTAGGIQKVRIFSLRGCHLIGMLSHTKVAKDFRKWVLDILDKETQQPQQIALPEPEPLISKSLTESEWLQFAGHWFALYNALDLLAKLEQPLQAIGSRFAVTAYTHAREYANNLGLMKRILEPMLAEFDVDPIDEPYKFNALKTLREFKVKGLANAVRLSNQPRAIKN
ncbi:P22AR C-terminal domain-containing protein [Lonepinella koalarum]|uniref:P22AR C-terminal domain-containing protein n=1 Tax=Lonepinella koalarum TaxID=53417 RepID=UPI003F6DE6B4